jgi:hypothetical protein
MTLIMAISLAFMVAPGTIPTLADSVRFLFKGVVVKD